MKYPGESPGYFRIKAVQFFLLRDRKMSAMRKEKITAALTPALAADRAPVNAPNSPFSAP